MCPYITCFPSFCCFMELDSQGQGQMDILLFFFLIEVKLMSNVVLISVVQQSDSVMYTVPIFLKMFICLSQRLAVVYGI